MNSTQFVILLMVVLFLNSCVIDIRSYVILVFRKVIINRFSFRFREGNIEENLDEIRDEIKDGILKRIEMLLETNTITLATFYFDILMSLKDRLKTEYLQN